MCYLVGNNQTFTKYPLNLECTMSPNTLLSLGFTLLCASVFVDSIQSATAYPQGPSVSLGTTPIHHATASCTSWDTLYTNNTSQPFLITDVVHSYPSSSSNATLRVNNQTIYASKQATQFRSGLLIQPGETVTCAHSGWEVTISGYYIH